MHRLTAKAVEAARPKDKPYKLTDGGGLYLFVSPTGLRSWRANFRLHGKQQTRTYGSFPRLSVAEARRAHFAAQENQEAPVQKKSPTFREVAHQWMSQHVPTLKNAKQRVREPVLFESYVFPLIGDRPIAELTRADLVEVVRALATRKIFDTTIKLAGRITQVLDYAQDNGIIETHAGNKLSRVAPARPPVRHMPCVPLSDAPELLRAIETYPDPVTRLALLTMSYCFVRVRELLGMNKNELRGDFWVIPADRMKLPLPHVVPVMPQVAQLIEEASTYSTSDLVFEGARGRPLSENTLLFALYRLGYRKRMTVHGFRTLASTALNEHGFSTDVIERQLAHKESNEVRAAYNRADYLSQRVEMMKWWAAQVDSWRLTPN